MFSKVKRFEDDPPVVSANVHSKAAGSKNHLIEDNPVQKEPIKKKVTLSPRNVKNGGVSTQRKKLIKNIQASKVVQHGGVSIQKRKSLKKTQASKTVEHRGVSAQKRKSTKGTLSMRKVEHAGVLLQKQKSIKSTPSKKQMNLIRTFNQNASVKTPVNAKSSKVCVQSTTAHSGVFISKEPRSTIKKPTSTFKTPKAGSVARRRITNSRSAQRSRISGIRNLRNSALRRPSSTVTSSSGSKIPRMTTQKSTTVHRLMFNLKKPVLDSMNRNSSENENTPVNKGSIEELAKSVCERETDDHSMMLFLMKTCADVMHCNSELIESSEKQIQNLVSGIVLHGNICDGTWNEVQLIFGSLLSILESYASYIDETHTLGHQLSAYISNISSNEKEGVKITCVEGNVGIAEMDTVFGDVDQLESNTGANLNIELGNKDEQGILTLSEDENARDYQKLKTTIDQTRIVVNTIISKLKESERRVTEQGECIEQLKIEKIQLSNKLMHKSEQIINMEQHLRCLANSVAECIEVIRNNLVHTVDQYKNLICTEMSKYNDDLATKEQIIAKLNTKLYQYELRLLEYQDEMEILKLKNENFLNIISSGNFLTQCEKNLLTTGGKNFATNEKVSKEMELLCARYLELMTVVRQFVDHAGFDFGSVINQVSELQERNEELTKELDDFSKILDKKDTWTTECRKTLNETSGPETQNIELADSTVLQASKSFERCVDFLLEFLRSKEDSGFKLEEALQSLDEKHLTISKEELIKYFTEIAETFKMTENEAMERNVCLTKKQFEISDCVSSCSLVTGPGSWSSQEGFDYKMNDTATSTADLASHTMMAEDTSYLKEKVSISELLERIHKEELKNKDLEQKCADYECQIALYKMHLQYQDNKENESPPWKINSPSKDGKNLNKKKSVDITTEVNSPSKDGKKLNKKKKSVDVTAEKGTPITTRLFAVLNNT